MVKHLLLRLQRLTALKKMSTKQHSLNGRSMIESLATAGEDGRSDWFVICLKMDRGLRRCIGYTVRRCLGCHFAVVATDKIVHAG